MRLKQQIDQDIKTAMLAGEKTLVTTLRGLKSTILYAEVAKGARDTGLTDDEIIELLAKEAKKRQESADLYKQGGSPDKAEAELAEKRVIEQYLPKPLSEAELADLVDATIKEMGEVAPAQMGQVISAVRTKTAGAADGSTIARLVKEKLTA